MTAPLVGLSVPRGTSSPARRGRFGRRPDRDPVYPAELKRQALTLIARGEPVAHVANFLLVPYRTLYAWRRDAERAS